MGRINQNIRSESCYTIWSQGIQKKLYEFEITLEKYKILDSFLRHTEENDIIITQNNLNNHKILENISPSQILQYQEYGMLLNILKQLSNDLMNADNESKYYSLK